MSVRYRGLLILLVLALAVATPFVASGYSELQKARSAATDLEAADHYLLAVQRLPWRADLYEQAADHLYASHEYLRAADAYQTAFEKDSLSPQGWVAWGDVHFLDGKTEEALSIWEDAVQRNIPAPQLYSRLAVVYERQEEFTKALDAVEVYLRSQPQDAEALYQYGLLLMLDQPQEGMRQITSASLLDPRFDPATQTLRTAVNLSALAETGSQGKVILGRGLGLVNEWGLARMLFEDAVQLDESNAEAWAWLGEADQHTGREEALPHLDRALELDPKSAVIRSLRGLYFQRVENHREALTEFKAAAELDPQNPQAYVALGIAYENAGDLIRALETMQMATTLAPDDAVYWEALAELCARNNSYVVDVGIPAAQKAVALQPDDASLQGTLGWLLTLGGRDVEGERLLKESLAADPQNASTLIHLALLYFEREDMDSMHVYLLQARELGSTEAEALLQEYFP